MLRGWRLVQTDCPEKWTVWVQSGGGYLGCGYRRPDGLLDDRSSARVVKGESVAATSQVAV